MSFQEKALIFAALYLSFCAIRGFLQGLFDTGPRQHVDADGSRWQEVRRQSLKERIAAKRAGKLVAADVLERREP